MSSKILTAAVVGLDAYPVEVEAVHASGLKNFFVVGLPDAAVKEARERVQAAVQSSGFEFPRGRVAVNLAPADVKKQGTSFDVPIALSVLSVMGEISDAMVAGKKSLFLGELGFDGQIRPVSGSLAVAWSARRAGFERLYVPKENAAEAGLVGGIKIFPVCSFGELIGHLRNGKVVEPYRRSQRKRRPASSDSTYDMAHVRGQESVKRALEIAAAGGHNILLSGPPGTGKTLLARTFATILPPLEAEEALEVTRIYTMSGLMRSDGELTWERPFRSPHHTTSGVALVGGGSFPRPGEVSLAHRGVLFLDEFPEFQRSVLEHLRQPMEDGWVTIARAAGTLKFPARFQLVGAMNPCPCGYATDPSHPCVCLPGQLARYRKRLSGPLLDRMDLLMEVPKVDQEKLFSTTPAESSEKIRGRVHAARERQRRRFGSVLFQTNSEMPNPAVRTHCSLNPDAERFLSEAVRRWHLSARGFMRILKVARTIADLAGEESLGVAHVAEALQFRQKGAQILV